MARFRLSNDADRDLDEIYLFSFEAFGEGQADAYMDALGAAFVRLAEMPELGVVVEPFSP